MMIELTEPPEGIPSASGDTAYGSFESSLASRFRGNDKKAPWHTVLLDFYLVPRAISAQI